MSALDPNEQERLYAVYEGYARGNAARRWNANNPGNRLIQDERDAATLTILKKEGFWPLSGYDILEIGCGSGGNLPKLLQWGATNSRLHGIELRGDKIDQARQRLPGVDLRVADACSFSLGQRCIDLVLLFTVLSSVPDDEKVPSILDQVRRMLRPNGGILYYDFFLKNPFNEHTRAMTSRRLARYFQGFSIDLMRVTVFPPIARNLFMLTKSAYPLLARMDFLKGHYIGFMRLAEKE